MESVEIAELFVFMKQMAFISGDMIKEAYDKPKNVDTKSSAADLVTETDRAVEDYIIGAIKEAYPNHQIIGEETSEKPQLTNEPTWVIDPVDGTTNFISGMPYIAVCIGFMLDKQIQCGVVFNPILDEFFSARRGCGAKLNDKTITVKPQAPLSQAVILTGSSSSRTEERCNKVFANVQSVCLAPCRGIRMIGSTACAITMVARGQADGYFGAGFHIWDIVAAEIILTEAGGVNTSLSGEEINYCNRQCIAASSIDLAKEIASRLEHEISDTPDGE